MEDLFNTTAGLLNESLLKIPNRRFMPDRLVQTVTTGNHLDLLGCRVPRIQGSSIALDYGQSVRASLGEFVERYSSALYRSEDFTVATWRQLRERGLNLLPLEDFRYYSADQYRELAALNVCPLGPDDLVEWVDAIDYLTDQVYMVPAFAVYMPYQSAVSSPHNYMTGATSTGIAAGATLQNAVVSGLCECAERHAFAQFWYRQDQMPYRQYTAATVLRHFRRQPVVRELFDNPMVRLKVFDLSPFAPLETMVVFLYFRYKEFDYQSLGCAARFGKTEALVKAALEAYQGIEYAISLKEKGLLEGPMDLSQITDFDRHFHFYNRFPECREHSRILREARQFDRGDEEVFERDLSRRVGRFCREDLLKTGLKHLLYKDLTPPDVAELSYRVARVITPGWSLLTGDHAWPFLGFSLEGQSDLYTRFPHPFP